MKVLFLDFDGVIITWKSYSAREDWEKRGNPVDATHVKFLERLFFHGVQHQEFKLVISSSWRFVEEMCREILDAGGLSKYLHEDWCTTRYPDSAFKLDGSVVPVMNRGSEIMEWLKRHPEVKEYRILDDDESGMEQHGKSFVKCDGVDGFGGTDMRQLTNWITPASKIGIW